MPEAAAESSALGKTEFDRLRALFDAQNEHLVQARTDGIDGARPDPVLAQRCRWRRCSPRSL